MTKRKYQAAIFCNRLRRSGPEVIRKSPNEFMLKAAPSNEIIRSEGEVQATSSPSGSDSDFLNGSYIWPQSGQQLQK